MRKRRWSKRTGIGAYLLASVCAGLAQDQRAVYPGVTVSASYAHDIAGRTDRIKGFLIQVGDPQTLKNPGLVILATGIGSPGQALLKFNGKDYAVPCMEGDFSGRDGGARPARSGSAADVAGEDVIAKIVIPLKAADVTAGVNQAEFFRGPNSGAYGVLAAQIESVTQTAPAALFARLAEPPVRKELAESLRKLEGAPLVTIEDARYVTANLVRKNGQNRFLLHLVNYDKPLKNVRVKVDFEGVADSIDSRSLRRYSPDAVSRTVNVTNSTGRILEFQVPELDVYDSITFN